MATDFQPNKRKPKKLSFSLTPEPSVSEVHIEAGSNENKRFPYFNNSDIILAKEQYAKDVLKNMEYVIEKYSVVTIDDFYAMCGVDSDQQVDSAYVYGWFDLKGTEIKKHESGYYIDFPVPVKLIDSKHQPTIDEDMNAATGAYLNVPSDKIDQIKRAIAMEKSGTLGNMTLWTVITDDRPIPHNAYTHEPPPSNHDGKPIWEYVMEDIHKRDEMGREKHGGPLVAFNGRDALWDAYQELLDLVVYLRQAIVERDNSQK